MWILGWIILAVFAIAGLITYSIHETSKTKATKDDKRKWAYFEQFVGQKLLSKLGMLAFLFGMAFLFKYAVDQSWIGDWMKITIGYLIGAVIFVVSYFLQNKYRLFSAVLTGGALALFYITTGFAYHAYQVIPHPIAFFILMSISAACIVISVVLDRQELAILSILGGFITPALLPAGNQLHGFFIYIIILQVTTVVLSYLKSWNVLSVLGTLGSSLLVMGWWFWQLNQGITPSMFTMVYLSILFLLFYALPFTGVGKQTTFGKVIRTGSLVLANVLYFWVFHYFLKWYNVDSVFIEMSLMGLLSALHLTLGWFFRKSNFDEFWKNLFWILGVVYAVLLPLWNWNSAWLTQIWVLEIGFLLVLSTITHKKWVLYMGLWLTGLAMISALGDWMQIYAMGVAVSHLISKAAWSTLSVSAILLAIYVLLGKRTFEMKEEFRTTLRSLSMAFALVVLLVGCGLECNRIGLKYFHLVEVLRIFITVFVLVAGAVVAWIGKLGKSKISAQIALYAFIPAIVVYTIILHPLTTHVLNDFIATSNAEFYSGYLLHFIGLVALLLHGAGVLLSKSTFKAQAWKFFIFLMGIATLSILSWESIQLAKWFALDRGFSVDHVLVQTRKIFFPILWTILGFGFMLYGLFKRSGTHRIVALSILALVFIKLIGFDVWNMDELGRIVVFLLLGLVLIIISFFYNKIKQALINGIPEVNRNSELPQTE